MPDQVKVEDLEVFGRFRVALLKFAQAADQSLTGADSEVAHTHAWLEGEQRSFWESQWRKRMEAATKARDAVRQKKLYKDVSGRTPSAVEEEKALAKCVAAVEEAQQKIEAVRKWVPRLEKEASLYRGGVARLGQTITDDIPRAVALLDRLAATLEQYVQIEAPDAGLPESAAVAGAEESMSRGGDAATELSPAPNTESKSDGQSGPLPESRIVKPKEGGDVAGGQ